MSKSKLALTGPMSSGKSIYRTLMEKSISFPKILTNHLGFTDIIFQEIEGYSNFDSSMHLKVLDDGSEFLFKHRSSKEILKLLAKFIINNDKSINLNVVDMSGEIVDKNKDHNYDMGITEISESDHIFFFIPFFLFYLKVF